jgi:eukaryotic-like serine/threonine-protein kinase
MALNAARAGLSDLALRIANLSGQAVLSWQPRWVAGASPVVMRGQKANSRRSVPLSSTLTIVTARSPDGSLTTWDLATRERIGLPVPCETDVWSIGQLDDSLVAVTCGHDGSICTWDLLAQEPVCAVMPGHGGTLVSAIAIGNLEGRAVAVTAGNDGTVRVWDLMTQQQMGDALPVHDSPARAVAIGEFEGRPAAFIGSQNGAVRAQCLMAQRQNTVIGSGEFVYALAAGKLKGDAVVVIVRGNRGAQVVDLKRRKISEFTIAAKTTVSAVTVGEVDGRAVVATGGRDGTIEIWDLASLKLIGVARRSG